MAWQGFDETRLPGVVAERSAELSHGGVDAVLEVNKNIGGPKPLLKFLAGDPLARPFQENDQNLKGETLQPDFYPVFEQLPRGQIG